MVNKGRLQVSGGSELSSYLAYVSNIKVLTADEEHELALDFYNNRNMEAAHKLVISHFPLVVKMAYSYKGYGLAVEDLISEGNIGLMRAVNKFDPLRGYRLSTYAMWWIKAYITDFILESWSLVKIGTLTARKKLFFTLNKIKNRLGITNASVTNEQVEMISEETGLSKRDVSDINTMISSKGLSLDVPLGEDSGANFAETLTSSVDDPEQQVSAYQEEQYKKHQISTALSALNERERSVLYYRYYLQKPMSLEEIGKKFSVSRERIRQIEASALKKARVALSGK